MTRLGTEPKPAHGGSALGSMASHWYGTVRPTHSCLRPVALLEMFTGNLGMGVVSQSPDWKPFLSLQIPAGPRLAF